MSKQDLVFRNLSHEIIQCLTLEDDNVDGVGGFIQDVYRIPSNKSESVIHSHFLNVEGKAIIRKGWPDFMVFTEDDMFVVEVKRKGDEIRPAQRVMLETLAKKGIDTYVAHVDGDSFWFEAIGPSVPWVDR